MNRLRELLHVRAGEAAPVALLFCYFTFVLTAYIISKAARDALFLNNFNAMMLPYVYVGVTVLIAILVSCYIRLSTRFSQPALVSASLVVFMINAIVLWWAFHVHWKPIPVVYYMWVNVFGIILTAQVWTIATSVLTTEQARRLFPLLCSGGVLGSLLGGVLAAAGVRHFGTGDLILAPVILLGFCVPIVRTLARHYAVKREEILEPVEVDEPSPGIGSALRVTMQTRYLRLIACLLSVSAIVTLLVDFQFKVIIQSYFRSTDAMTEFFGQFYACVGLASFAFQLVAGAKFFERYGLRIALMSLPLTLLGGTAALIVFPSLVWTGIFLKGSDGVLRSSIDKSTMEMLYIPIPLSVKVHVKAVIDMLVQRFSDGVGGVLLLFLTQALGLGLTGIGVFNVGLLLAWIWIARQTRREYSVAMRGHAGPSQSKAA